MNLPLVHWLSRPMARLLRWTFMGRAPLGPVGTPGACTGLPRPGKKREPRPSVRLSLDVLETRWVPDDLLSMMRPAASAVGFSIFSAVILGHDANQQSLPPAPATDGGGGSSAADRSPDNI